MQDMIAHAGFQTAAAASVGKVATVDCDGPSAVSNNFTGAGSVGFPSNVMIACTWNDELAYTYGYDMGKMATELGCSGWYAPSMNLHRSALEAVPMNILLKIRFCLEKCLLRQLREPQKMVFMHI